ncbi:conjugal transfer pilus assembly protein TraW (plasmid) [Rickettsiales bacterium Ac37b]|nr:conjugal transfer pilus assembly protein TraW [Rickettsiales bacterium Ac37b]
MRGYLVEICFLLLFMFVLIKFSYAKDFGVQGHIFPIIEEDILKLIEKRLSELDMEKINHDMQEKTKDYIENPKSVAGIKTAKESKIFYFDPTYVLKENIYDHENNLLHSEGTKVNPLEQVSLEESLLFIDGLDERQVNLALKLAKEKDNKVKIILTSGSPLKLQREHKKWIYFDQGGIITSKLSIIEVPALVEQEGVNLKISILGEDSYE